MPEARPHGAGPRKPTLTGSNGRGDVEKPQGLTRRKPDGAFGLLKHCRSCRRAGNVGGTTVYPVIVVGAGIAGCRAARTLAGRGVEVLLVDRATFPRWKPCAGGLSLKARPYLDGPLGDLVEVTVRGAWLVWDEERWTHLRSPDPMGWLVHRETFDSVHLELARSDPRVQVLLGVKVLGVHEHPWGVVVETERGDFTAESVIGADGANGVVSRAVPGHEERLLGFAYEGEAVPALPRLEGEVYFHFQAFPWGYGWIFPKAHHYSLGGYVFGRSQPGIKERYEEFCGRISWLRESRTYRTRGHPVVMGGDLRRPHTRRIALAGEAAGLVDPLTGEGIYYALRSGDLAGRAVDAFLRRGVPLEAYGDLVRTEIQEDLRWARVLAHILYRFPAWGFRLLFETHHPCQGFAGVSAGHLSYAHLVRRWLASAHEKLEGALFRAAARTLRKAPEPTAD